MRCEGLSDEECGVMSEGVRGERLRGEGWGVTGDIG